MAARPRRRPLPVLTLAMAVGCVGMVALAPAASARGGGLLGCLLRGRCGTSGSTSTTTSTSTTSTSATSTSAPTTTVPTSTAGCGTVPNPDGGTWHCTFDDEFDGTSLDRTRWTPSVTAPGTFDTTTECYVDSPNNIAVGGGALSLTVRKEAAPFSCAGVHQSQYTSASVSTSPNLAKGFAQTNGRFEIRAKFTGGANKTGTQESIWLWPKTYTGTWPYTGEIDIAEAYGQYPDRVIPYVHYSNVLDLNVTNDYCMVADFTKYHTYALDWTPESLKVTFDGQTCIDDHWVELLPPWGRHPFDAPFFLVLTQALGQGSNAFNAATTPLPTSTVVDYVRVWGS